MRTRGARGGCGRRPPAFRTGRGESRRSRAPAASARWPRSTPAAGGLADPAVDDEVLGGSATSGSRLFMSIRSAASCCHDRPGDRGPRGARTVRAVALVVTSATWASRRRRRGVGRGRGRCPCRPGRGGSGCDRGARLGRGSGPALPEGARARRRRGGAGAEPCVEGPARRPSARAERGGRGPRRGRADGAAEPGRRGAGGEGRHLLQRIQAGSAASRTAPSGRSSARASIRA